MDNLNKLESISASIDAQKQLLLNKATEYASYLTQVSAVMPRLYTVYLTQVSAVMPRLYTAYLT